MLTTTTRGPCSGRQRAQHAQPVEVRHHQIERDHVGLQLGDLLERLEPVARDADHLELGAGRAAISRSTLRANAESSTTSTRVRSLQSHGAFL